MQENILSQLLRVEDIPTLPQVITRIIEVADDDRSSARDLTELLETDHAISTRVLRLANSAFYGLGSQVDSIRRAVVVLGFDAVRNLALATSVFTTLSGEKQFSLDPTDFWMHSFGCAKISLILCKRHFQVESPEGCFTAALLHDVGKYFLAISQKEKYRFIVREAQKRQVQLWEVEQESLGINHTRVGSWLTEKWNFPPLFKTIIRNLYHPSSYEGPYLEELWVVALADAISRQADFGKAGDFDEAPLKAAHLQKSKIPHQDLMSIAGEVAELRQETRRFLSLVSES